jgi:putative copper export protein
VIETLLAPLQQWLLFAGVVVITGCVAWRTVVVPGAMRALTPGHAPVAAEVAYVIARVGMFAGLATMVAWAVRMVDQVIRFRDPFVPLSEDVSFLLFETTWGTVWMAQGAIVPLVILAFWLARRGGVGDRSDIGGLPAPWVIATVLAVALVATLAMSGHAMGVESLRPLIVTADGLHALAAGVWIGTLGLIITVGRSGRTERAGFEFFAAQIRAFSPMAMVSVAALVSMGTVLAWTHLTALSDLWTTNYGRILSAKVALTMGVLLAGLVNWRRGVPSLATEAGVNATLRRSAVEVVLALGVLLLTAFLVHSVKP